MSVLTEIYLMNLDMNGNELQNVVIQVLAVRPTSPKMGQIIFNSTTLKLESFNGTTWEAGGGTLTPATAVALGGVMIPAGSSITVDSSGNIDLKTTLLTLINNALQGINLNGTALTPDANGKIDLNDIPILIAGKLPSHYFPSALGKDITFVPNFASLPTTPATEDFEDIFITQDTGIAYIWNGSSYTQLTQVLAFATKADALAGTATDVVMSPLRTKEAIDEALKNYLSKARFLVGDGAATSIPITHNLGVRRPIISAWYNDNQASIGYTPIDDNGGTIEISKAVESGSLDVTFAA